MLCNLVDVCNVPTVAYLFHINSSYDRTDANVSDCHGFVHALNNQKPTVEGKHSITQRVQYSSIVKKSIFRNLLDRRKERVHTPLVFGRIMSS